MVSSSLNPGMHARRQCGSSSVFLAAAFLVTVQSASQSRRAVLAGIDQYDPEPATRARITAPIRALPTPGRAGRLHSLAIRQSGRRGQRRCADQDVLADLGITEFVILRDPEATADAILSALQKNPVDDAKVGDIPEFYYSGTLLYPGPERAMEATASLTLSLASSQSSTR
jgi:hypothetical protein